MYIYTRRGGYTSIQFEDGSIIVADWNVGTEKSRVFVYDPDTRHWNRITDRASKARYIAATLNFNNDTYHEFEYRPDYAEVCGGNDDTSDDVWVEIGTATSEVCDRTGWVLPIH